MYQALRHGAHEVPPIAGFSYRPWLEVAVGTALTKGQDEANLRNGAYRVPPHRGL